VATVWLGGRSLIGRTFDANGLNFRVPLRERQEGQQSDIQIVYHRACRRKKGREWSTI
jgi:hypothetical protein